MDALKALSGQQGCAPDGTAARRNPLSRFVGQAMSGPGKGDVRSFGPGPHAAPGHHAHMSEVDEAVARGMGAMDGPMALRMAGPVDAGPNGPMVQPHHPPEEWIEQFGRMNTGRHLSSHRIGMEAAYRNSFRPRVAHPMGQRWVGQMADLPPPSRMDHAWQRSAPVNPTVNQWQNELSGPKEAPDAQAWVDEATKEDKVATLSSEDPDMAATRRATESLVEAMSSDPKFRNSGFLDFMSKVSNGELSIENNSVIESGVKTSNNVDKMVKSSLEKSWETLGGDIEDSWSDNSRAVESIFSEAWNNIQNGKEVDIDDVIRKAEEESGLFKQSNSGGIPLDDALRDQVWTDSLTGTTYNGYRMSEENTYVADDNCFEKGMELFKRGDVREAILAFEAATKQDDTDANAWHMLGMCHQESDSDFKAIACLERATQNDSVHLDALLALGVSYLNELDQDKALQNLKNWVMANPNFYGLSVESDLYGDGSLMDDVMQLMLKVAEWSPGDPDVNQVLGVLYNASRDYVSAARCFRAAINGKPNDYTLWNKLGATLANGGYAKDAIPAYERSLELRPRYARGWLNLGISRSNSGEYVEAVRCYFKSLQIVPEASHIWSYLRINFSCLDRFDLIDLADKQDIAGLGAALSDMLPS